MSVFSVTSCFIFRPILLFMDAKKFKMSSKRRRAVLTMADNAEIIKGFLLVFIIRGKVKNYPHFCFSNLFTQKLRLNKYVIFLHSLLPFRCTWSGGPQACAFPPRRRFSVGRATIYAPLPVSAFGANCWLQIVGQQITVACTVDRTPLFQVVFQYRPF
jgi:hypothetical protein